MNEPAAENCAGTVLLPEAQIRTRVAELGEQITLDYQGREPIFVAVMQGAVVFFADLIREVKLPLRCDTISVSSYRNRSSSAGEPQLLLEPREDWTGQDIIFVDTIVDSGKTAGLLFNLARRRGAGTARLCALLDKPSRRVCDVNPDYTGFTIPNLFVVGYGLDYQGRERNLSYVKAVTV